MKNEKGKEAHTAHQEEVYRWFSPDVVAAMLVHRRKEKKVFWEFDLNYNAKHEP